MSLKIKRFVFPQKSLNIPEFKTQYQAKEFKSQKCHRKIDFLTISAKTVKYPRIIKPHDFGVATWPKKLIFLLLLQKSLNILKFQ